MYTENGEVKNYGHRDTEPLLALAGCVCVGGGDINPLLATVEWCYFRDRRVRERALSQRWHLLRSLQRIHVRMCARPLRTTVRAE